MSLSSLFRFTRSNEGLEVKNMNISVLAFLIRHSFTEIKYFAECLFMEHESMKFL